MAFGSFVQTNFGRQLDAKHYAGKVLHFSRLALGDGDIGTSSVYDVTELKSEKLSLKIDAVSVTADEAIVTASLLSSLVDTGFNLKEMGLMATDPDTNEEGVYSYNRDTSAGEYVPDKNSSTKLSEYLRVRCKVEDTQNITFEASGNPLYVTQEDLQKTVGDEINSSKGHAGGLAEFDVVKEHIDDVEKHLQSGERDTWNKKVSSSSLVSTTLTAAGWTGSSAPYSQTVSVVGVTAANANEIIPGLDISDDQLEALQAANIQDGGQSTGQITLMAYGDKPTINLPIRIITRRDL